MDYPKFIVSNQKEESISIQTVKVFMLSVIQKLVISQSAQNTYPARLEVKVLALVLIYIHVHISHACS